MTLTSLPPGRDRVSGTGTRPAATRPLAEAIADPATPEAYLMRAAAGQDEHLPALMRRRPMSPEFSRWLVCWTLVIPTNTEAVHQLVAAAAVMPHVGDVALRHLVGRLFLAGRGRDEALLAIATRPDASPETVCSTLDRAEPDGAFTLALARTGSLMPAARRLAMSEGRFTSPLWHNRVSTTLEVLAELETMLPDGAARQIAATLGPTWSHSRDALVRTAFTIACDAA